MLIIGLLSGSLSHAATPADYDLVIDGRTSAGVAAAMQAKKMGSAVFTAGPRQAEGENTQPSANATPKHFFGLCWRNLARTASKHYWLSLERRQ